MEGPSYAQRPLNTQARSLPREPSPYPPGLLHCLSDSSSCHLAQQEAGSLRTLAALSPSGVVSDTRAPTVSSHADSRFPPRLALSLHLARVVSWNALTSEGLALSGSSVSTETFPECYLFSGLGLKPGDLHMHGKLFIN
jgi:hypothetical protein